MRLRMWAMWRVCPFCRPLEPAPVALRTCTCGSAAAGARHLSESASGARADADITDHILLLQTSLYHYEYILAHCQPAYLSHVRWSYNITRRLISKKILVLSTVTVTILPLQTVTGIFSMNVRIPRNGDAEHFLPDGVTRAGFSWFGAIVAIVFTVICVMCGLVR